MEIVIILAAAGIGAYLYSKSKAVAASVSAPLSTPTVSTVNTASPATAPAYIPPAPQDTAVQQELSTLEQEIANLTKPADPLKPKTPPAPVVSVLPSINPTTTAQEALTEAMQAETNLNPRDWDSAHQARYVGEILNWHTLAWNPATKSFDNWSGGFQPGPNLQLVGQGSEMALSVAGTVATKVGSSIASAIPFVGAVVGGIVGLFGAISAHHKAAVQRDTSAYNQGLAAVENYLQIIHDAVFGGQSTPDEGINALDSMYSDFLTFTAPARNNHPYCNSVCEAKVIVNATVIYWKAYFTQLTVAGAGGAGVTLPAPASPAAPTPTAGPTLPAAFPRLFIPARNR